MTSLLFIQNSFLANNIGLIETGARLLVKLIEVSNSINFFSNISWLL
ncbi:hypothetical protein LDG_8189 [Legionella drancourtii LLAP12]|uniref:Uncharacterized protein n=1 Tax=Legionella drancourtii LLAP12 TaxID=658187 RepID=G9ESB6_9GAMM|nr:hypothetical protein LDG_8189 [Legionella drancourtii LLAP12]